MTSEVLHRVKEARNILHTIKRGKAIWIGNILGGNHLSKHVIEVKAKRRRTRRRKKLLDDREETRIYCNRKDEALHCPPLGSCFGRGCGPVSSQITKGSNERMNE